MLAIPTQHGDPQEKDGLSVALLGGRAWDSEVGSSWHRAEQAP